MDRTDACVAVEVELPRDVLGDSEVSKLGIELRRLWAIDEAIVGIRELSVLEGSLPKRAEALVLEWAAAHQNELLEDWDLCRALQTPKQIPPLE